MSVAVDSELEAHIIRDLGMALRQEGDGLAGVAPIVREMSVPGTQVLRTSVLATWTDLLSGLLVGQVLAPRVPVTLDLTVDLYRTTDSLSPVHGRSHVVKAGRSVVVTAVAFEQDGQPLATATTSFMAAPDAMLTMPSLAASLARNHTGGGRLAQPLAERAQCEVRSPGVAVQPWLPDGLNAAGSINGGLIALAVEEAVLSAAAEGSTLATLALRYLRAARTGPAVATADLHAGVARVQVSDAGDGDRLVGTATARLAS